jgi:hypothetical protein
VKTPSTIGLVKLGDLYYVLARALFPSLKEIRAVYADDRLPPIIVISAKSDMITRTLAGYIVPYVRTFR